MPNLDLLNFENLKVWQEGGKGGDHLRSTVLTKTLYVKKKNM